MASENDEVIWRLKKRFHGPWFGNDTERLLFERSARLRGYPFSRRFVAAGVEYKSSINLNEFEPRVASIAFEKRSPTYARVVADGPTESPHRYPNGNLCIWYPNDPSENRWEFSDGLGPLIEHVALHLYREAYWREFDEWLGPQAPHLPKDSVP